MSKSVIINGVVYSDVPYVEIPLSTGSGEARFDDTSDASLDSGAKMLAPYTAYADGTKYTGSIATKTGSDITASGDTVTVPAGYYAIQQTKAVAAGSATPPTTISGSGATLTPGTNTLTLQKTLNVTPQVSPGYVAAGTQGSVLVSLNTSVPTRAAATITPGTSDQTIASGTYLTGAQTVLGDSDLVPGNIKSGVEIFGVAGSLTSATVSQDSVTKVLAIS